MRQRVGPRLFHDVGTMGLDRKFTGSEFIRDLLVQKACNDQVQNLRLARREGLEAFTNIRQLRTLLAQLPVVSDCLLNGIEQILTTNRLGQERDSNLASEFRPCYLESFLGTSLLLNVIEKGVVRALELGSTFFNP
jgi:hypothetical protein